ncbi:MAG: metal-dependent transcriptional regulator [Firmicutes bacterium]|jgi:DtxR family Mn-dependent transcriptional regulator|nr:metal-dependent transcriptional regulator [Bacillota bacterium]
MKLQESGENYLETILILEKRNGIARSVDIANELGFSKPSVSRAMSVLKEAGYVKVGQINQLVLTETGREIAEKVYHKHCVLKSFLMQIGVEEEIASKDACRMEHVISEQTLECILKHMEEE